MAFELNRSASSSSRRSSRESRLRMSTSRSASRALVTRQSFSPYSFVRIANASCRAARPAPRHRSSRAVGPTSLARRQPLTRHRRRGHATGVSPFRPPRSLRAAFRTARAGRLRSRDVGAPFQLPVVASQRNSVPARSCSQSVGRRRPDPPTPARRLQRKSPLAATGLAREAAFVLLLKPASGSARRTAGQIATLVDANNPARETQKGCLAGFSFMARQDSRIVAESLAVTAFSRISEGMSARSRAASQSDGLPSKVLNPPAPTPRPPPRASLFAGTGSCHAVITAPTTIPIGPAMNTAGRPYKLLSGQIHVHMT